MERLELFATSVSEAAELCAPLKRPVNAANFLQLVVEGHFFENRCYITGTRLLPALAITILEPQPDALAHGFDHQPSAKIEKDCARLGDRLPNCLCVDARTGAGAIQALVSTEANDRGVIVHGRNPPPMNGRAPSDQIPPKSGNAESAVQGRGWVRGIFCGGAVALRR